MKTARIPVLPALLWIGLGASLFGQGLPPVPVPVENPITPEKAMLGKILFWDEQLSSDNTVSCGTCHRPEAGGADPRLAVNPGRDGAFGTADDAVGSPGVRASDALNRFLPDGLFGHAVQVTGRAAPSFIGAQWAQELFWDGRASAVFLDPETGILVQTSNSGLESQAVGPILSAVEMANDGRDWASVVVKLLGAPPLRLASNVPTDMSTAIAANPTYSQLFAAAFGDPSITPARIGQAIATYERSLVPDQTPFDRFVRGDRTALSAAQIRGLQVFQSVGQCNFCHLVPTFSDGDFHNIGVRPAAEDIGREGVTGNPADRGRMKTPALRNFALKPTYMHNGRFTTVAEVVDFYIRGGDFADNLSTFITPLNLTAQQRLDLIDFLENGLTDPRVANATAPFDRPTLYSERVPTGSNKLGVGTPGALGFVPYLLADAPLATGDGTFKVGIAGGFGGSDAWIFASPAPAAPGTSIHGFPAFIDFVQSIFIDIVRLDGSGPGEGFGTYSQVFTPHPSLTGVPVYIQAFVVDPFAPFGGTVTEGARIEIY